MTPDLEQLADEAIELRCTNIESAIGRHRIDLIQRNRAGEAEIIDRLDRSRTVIGATWAALRPALARLADQRLAAIARLAEQGITPDNGCTVTEGRVTLEAVRDRHHISHRYRILRGREQAGWAWLTDSSLGNYVVRIEIPSGIYSRHAHTLQDVLDWAAHLLNSEPLAKAGAS